jgi:hypothetical protein
MAEPAVSKPAASDGQRTHVAEIGKWVLGISGGIILVVSVVVLVAAKGVDAEEFSKVSSMVFNALLPLLGTWVGTVLAYYYSRQNFESASESVERMVTTMTMEQKLAQISVEKEMLRPDRITMYTVQGDKQPNQVLLSELRGIFRPGISRLPIVDDKRVVQYIVHQSGLYKFITDKVMSGATKEQIEKLTLQDLVDDAELKLWVANIVYVPENASVGAAKQAMEARPGCQDLIVTKTGKKDEPMLGWMTNVQIGSLSKA